MDFTKLDDDDDDISNSVDNDSKDCNDFEDEEMSDDPDDSEEDDSDADDEAFIVAEINKLQDELSHNPYDYDKHVKLIEAIRLISVDRENGQLDCLRSAREKMNKVFPLSPKLWKEWIQDEISVSNTPEQCKNVIDLYKRAVSDYIDFDLWKDFVNYAIEQKNLIGIDSIREILDKALAQAGLHVKRGSSIWTLYRNFEMSILEDNDGLEEQKRQELLQKQMHRIYELYCRQISLPLNGIEEVYLEFLQWLNEVEKSFKINLKQNDFSKIETKYNKALKKYKLLENYENKLQNSDSPHYQEYVEYLEFVKSNDDDLARTQCLYERAITDNCLQIDLWLDYLTYCNSKFVVEEIILPIYERATRNCYWDGNIWILYLEAAERVGLQKSSKDLQSQLSLILERALKSVSFEYYLNLWITYLCFLRRLTNKIGWNDYEAVENLRSSLRSAIDQLESYKDADYCYQIYNLYADIEAHFLKNLTNGRTIWNEFLDKSSSLKHQAETWLDYGQFELLNGDIEHVRQVSLKGLNICKDVPEKIGEWLLKVERTYGDDISVFQQSKIKYEKIIKKINEKRLRQQNESQKHVKCDVTTSKRKADNNLVKDEHSINKKKKISQKTEESIRHGVTVQTDESKRDETIFISNLDFNVDEEELRKIFSQFGEVRDVRLVLNYKGLSKGYAYIEFNHINSVQKALKHDRMLIRQRPVFITEMDKRKSFQYGRNKEDNKLFIKNIPLEITEEEFLDKVFSEYRDSIISARLVTRRDGRSRGIAYIDMKDAESAAKAVQEKNEFELCGRNLIVAISDPTKSFISDSKDLNQKHIVKPSSNEEFRKPGPTSMVPHSLLRTRSSKVKLQIGNEHQPPQSSSSALSQNQEAVSKSGLNNDQFRSMFLK
ncbi:spliceosome associated factor 3, U4/U6 recycling protein-like [Dermatophagoides pteronyssinus]|uniref:spliceosome associated factor 3, U4/U6 recycling protein-like n=1 Tax=Dermatophagoides pteronyssinus TaxID=6956 RepID=UPI003F67EB5D